MLNLRPARSGDRPEKKMGDFPEKRRGVFPMEDLHKVEDGGKFMKSQYL